MDDRNWTNVPNPLRTRESRRQQRNDRQQKQNKNAPINVGCDTKMATIGYGSEKRTGT